MKHNNRYSLLIITISVLIVLLLTFSSCNMLSQTRYNKHNAEKVYNLLYQSEQLFSEDDIAIVDCTEAIFNLELKEWNDYIECYDVKSHFEDNLSNESISNLLLSGVFSNTLSVCANISDSNNYKYVISEYISRLNCEYWIDSIVVSKQKSHNKLFYINNKTLIVDSLLTAYESDDNQMTKAELLCCISAYYDCAYISNSQKAKSVYDDMMEQLNNLSASSEERERVLGMEQKFVVSFEMLFSEL